MREIFVFGVIIIVLFFWTRYTTRREINKLYKKVKPLTKEEIITIKDGAELQSRVFDTIFFNRIFSHKPESDEEIFKLYTELTTGQKAFYATSIFEFEVVNGGFTNLYTGSNKMFVDEAIKGYLLFGSTRLAKLVEDSQQAFEKVKGELKPLIEHIDKPNEPEQEDLFRKLNEESDTLFNVHKPGLLRTDYISKHPEEFCGKFSE